MTISIGVVGLGSIARTRHLPSYVRHPNLNLVGVFDRDDERTAATASAYDVGCYDSTAALAEDVSLIAVCTPPWAHSEPARVALSTGCDVLTEKPMAMTSDDAADLLDTARSESQSLYVVNNFRYMRSMRSVLSEISPGTVTSVYGVQLRQFDHDEHGHEWFERLPGGMLWDESPHMLYLIRAVLGGCSLVEATATERDGPKQKHNFHAQFENEHGTRGQFTMNFDSPVTEWWFVVLTHDAIYLVDLFRDLTIRLSREKNHSAVRVLTSSISGASQFVTGFLTSGLSLLRDRVRHDYRVPDAGLYRQVGTVVEEIQRGDRTDNAAENLADLRRMEEIVRTTGLSRE